MQLFLFSFPLQHIKRPALQNKQVVVLRMAFRARKVLGTFEKRAPGVFLFSQCEAIACLLRCFPDCCSFTNKSAVPTAAIIGAAFSGVTMAVASLTGLFHVPVISYASTSRLLSDRSRFQYFYRTVPSDDLQAHAITDLLYELRWHFVILLASDNEYGRSGITAIKQAIYNHTAQRVCVVVEEVFSRKGTKNEMGNIFRKIKKANNARVIILYVEFPDAVFFFKEAKKEFLQDYLFVASDSWVGSSEVIKDAGNVFRSIIGFRPPVFPIPKFDLFFADRLRGSFENPWTSDLSKSSNCSGNRTQQCYNEVHHNGYVPYIIDAVFSVAHALHAMLNCNRRACTKKLGNVEQRHLSQFIQNVSFEGFSEKNFFFNEKGTTRGKYEVYIVRNGSSTYKRIGIWNGSFSLRLNLSRASKYGTSVKLPASVCSEDCRKGDSLLCMLKEKKGNLTRPRAFRGQLLGKKAPRIRLCSLTLVFANFFYI